MSCNAKYEDHVWEAAETGSVSAELRRHLDACESCRASLRELTSAMQGFAVLREVRSPDPRTAVRAELAKKSLPYHRRALVGALAVACCLVLVAVLWSLQPRRPVSGGEVAPRSEQIRTPAPAPSVRVAGGDGDRHPGKSTRPIRLAGKRHVRPSGGHKPWSAPDEGPSAETIPVETVTVVVSCDRIAQPDESNPQPRYVRVLEEVRMVRARDIPPLNESPERFAALYASCER